MIEFYTVSWVTRILITFLIGICVLLQSLTIMLGFYRYNKTQQRIFKNLFEVGILIQILMFSLLHGEVVNGYKNGIVIPAGYESMRISIFLGILILGLLLSYINKTLVPLSVIIIASISLPMVENMMGPIYPWFFIGSLLFLLMRSIKINVINFNAIRTSISALSITQAVDTLPTGVLYSESDGYIVLSNYQMQDLMLAITGKVFRDAVEFYESLISDKYKSRYKKVKLEGQAVYLLPDNTAWIFTKTDIHIQMKNYIHISAVDVSENWALTAKLQDQDQELRQKSSELKKTISNLHILSKEKEIENAKIRAHDILGQRLTVLLRMIQNDHKLDYDLLKSLSKGLLEELKAEDNQKSPLDELKTIQQIFTSIGVDINFKGQLPQDEERANLVVDIIRESSANAVRHGFATRVDIGSEEKETSYNLNISNIGHTSSDPVTPGSGIQTIKKKVNAMGGTLEIISHPKFTLSVVLPGGDKSG